MGVTGRRLFGIAVCTAFFYISGTLFYLHVERPAELAQYKLNKEWRDGMEKLFTFEHCNDPAFATLDFCKNQQKAKARFTEFWERGGNAVNDVGKWSIWGCCFFLTQLCTTVGYGGIYPITATGKTMTIFFGLMGLPLMANLLNIISHYQVKYANHLLEAMNLKVSHKGQMMVLGAAVLIQMLIGTICMGYLEDWRFLNSAYFCFITMSTVGFGDFVPITNYGRVFVMFFILTSLGTFACLVSVMTLVVEERHAEFVKHTAEVKSGKSKP